MNACTHQYKTVNIEAHKQTIYDHLLQCVRTESANAVLKRFHTLFIAGLHYPEPEVKAALNQIVVSIKGKEDFALFFNRCCYILVNSWQNQPDCRSMIPELVAVLGRMSAAPATLGRSRSKTRLRSLMQQFAQSSYYQRLRRFSEFITPQTSASSSRPLSTILRRYPYLYQHCLISKEDSQEHQSSVRQVQQHAQEQFELDLSHYLTGIFKRPAAPGQIIQPAGRTQLILPDSGPLIRSQNPTLLGDNELCKTLKQYVGRVDHQGSYRDGAKHFILRNQASQTYLGFKKNLYDYLVASVDTKFGRCRFNQQLQKQFDALLPECNDRPMSDFLLVRTCNRLLNFLVVESRQRPNHIVFMDLINNVGSTATVGLLLKVVLLCKKIKPYLENRFALLFNHYEAKQQGAVKWLVACLEKLNLAWSANFGRFDFSFVTAL
ncbi:hypothetical protein C1752_00867 [Acaryochloris thomasi RCC1774]|uniref:Uncharacterized protein n=1 Tax=Acaryochloris thomasi RCC1774 TaxID=1764569 RepID=A0A2W1JMM0_9CYAN|nr:hypothetical protein [Acaryochloris thomasi]PZD74558.1 hypothetical protein C1752_00867 [Acaryochloris thomasi RCC1774]